METLLKLSPAQSLLLRTAARRADGRVIPPDTLRGGARVKVLTSLLQRGWIEPADDGHVLTDAGYAAIGQQRPMPPDECKPQTLQTLVCTRTVAKRRARAPRMGTSPGRTPFAWGEAQMSSGSCIHAGMSRWPCSTRQTSTWSERST
jgi:hypothetical protein